MRLGKGPGPLLTAPDRSASLPPGSPPGRSSGPTPALCAPKTRRFPRHPLQKGPPVFHTSLGAPPAPALALASPEAPSLAQPARTAGDSLSSFPPRPLRSGYTLGGGSAGARGAGSSVGGANAALAPPRSRWRGTTAPGPHEPSGAPRTRPAGSGTEA